ncbi:hypothetical protein ACY46J_004631, partial [Escherichia albertii]
MYEKYAQQSIYVRKKSGILLRMVTLPHSLNPPMGGFFMPEELCGTLNTLVVANTVLSFCWFFRQTNKQILNSGYLFVLSLRFRGKGKLCIRASHSHPKN